MNPWIKRVRYLGIVLIIGAVLFEGYKSYFSFYQDVPVEHYAFEEIRELKQSGLIKKSEFFYPNESITKKEVFTWYYTLYLENEDDETVDLIVEAKRAKWITSVKQWEENVDYKWLYGNIINTTKTPNIPMETRLEVKALYHLKHPKEQKEFTRSDAALLMNPLIRYAKESR